MRKFAVPLVALLVMSAVPAAAAQPAPTPLPACALSDLTAAIACSGYFAGNLNSGNSSDILAQQSALASIGFTWDGNFSAVEKIDILSGLDVDFTTLLTGISFVSVHWGSGQGPVSTPGGVTGFYKINAGAGLDKLTSAFGSVSNAVLYKTDLPGGVGGVPEPLVWIQLILGMGIVGSVARRRRRTVSA